MPGLLAHGLQTLAQTAPGACLFPYITEEALIGFIEQSCRFLKPVFAGDTIYPALVIDELTANRHHRRRWFHQHDPQSAARTGAAGAAALPAAQTPVGLTARPSPRDTGG
jgi:acyl dehydratase